MIARMRIDPRLVISPCCNPEAGFDEALAAYAGIGFQAMEAFTGWCRSSVDWRGDPAAWSERAAAYGIRFTSLHLPGAGADEAATVAQAIQAATFAAGLGVETVLVKADTIDRHERCDRAVVEAACALGLVPVLQNHRGSALETPEHIARVLDAVGDDRLRVLLEVGHYHSVGQHWLEPWRRFGERVALVHLKDQVGARSVPYGTGEVDLRGLITRLEGDGYRGRYVVELELEDRSLAHVVPLLADAAARLEPLLARQTATAR
jgi:sugar phosphate isomerase/epimerase